MAVTDELVFANSKIATLHGKKTAQVTLVICFVVYPRFYIRVIRGINDLSAATF
jgi:hypothetical protein